MARSFTATTDAVSRASVSIPSTYSFTFWLKTASAGRPSNATFVRGENGDDVMVDAATTDFRIDRLFSTTAGSWRCTAANHGLDLTVWNHIAVTHDASSTSNVPVFYGNGVSKTVTTSTAPVGSVVTTANTLTIGNWSSNSRQANGPIAWLALHNVILTFGEIQMAMRRGFASRGLVAVWPLYGADSPEPDLSGSRLAATVTGTTAVAGPPTTPSVFGS